jgi:RNA polymerase sigma factor (sigma-70 family)
MQEKSAEEALLWLQFKNGDKEAYARLYRLFSLPLIAYGFRLCPDSHLLKDQIQELFVELWNSRNNLSPTDSVKFYLFRALRYKLIRLEKGRHSRIALLSRTTEWTGDLLQQPVEDSIVEKEMVESRVALLKKAMKDLTLRQQEVIHLRFYQGFSHEQISVLMDMNHQSVRNLLHRALVRLRDRIRVPVLTTLTLFFSFFFL